MWNWLDGNKTLFGSIILNIAAVIPSDTEIAGVPVQGILLWLGGILGGGGLVHKVKKKVSP